MYHTNIPHYSVYSSGGEIVSRLWCYTEVFAVAIVVNGET
jgi:hypothetical protein